MTHASLEDLRGCGHGCQQRYCQHQNYSTQASQPANLVSGKAILTPTEPKPKKKSSGLDRHCGACGEGGHNQRNRKCPKRTQVQLLGPIDDNLILFKAPGTVSWDGYMTEMDRLLQELVAAPRRTPSLTVPWLPLATAFTVGLSAAALVLAIVVRMGWVLG